MFFGLLREEGQTFQRMVKNGMKSGRQEGSVLIFSLHSQPNKYYYGIHPDNHASHTYRQNYVMSVISAVSICPIWLAID